MTENQFRSALVAAGIALAALFAHPAAAGEVDRELTLTGVISRINRQRSAADQSVLKRSSELMDAAQDHAEELASNTYLEGSTGVGGGRVEPIQARVRSRGYRAPVSSLTLNSAAAPKEVLAALSARLEQRNLMLTGGYSEIGLGFARNRDESFTWVLLFGTRRTFHVVINDEAQRTSDPASWLYIEAGNAVQAMRFSNDGHSWTEWEAFRSRREWTLDAGTGARVVYVELRDAAGRTQSVSDTIDLIDPNAPLVVPPAPGTPSTTRLAGKAAATTTPSFRTPRSAGIPQLPWVNSEVDEPAPAPPAKIQMVFPIAGGARYSNTWGAPRSGGRRHHGQDLMSPKMRRLVATFDGRVYFSKAGGLSGHTIHVVGDHGWTSVYRHVNNDTPGTDDGQAADHYIFAPGLRSGDRVIAGQFIGYVGDSGNAESTAPHLHFELVRGGAVVNPYGTLRAAQVLAAPRNVELARRTAPSPTNPTVAGIQVDVSASDSAH